MNTHMRAHIHVNAGTQRDVSENIQHTHSDYPSHSPVFKRKVN